MLVIEVEDLANAYDGTNGGGDARDRGPDWQ